MALHTSKKDLCVSTTFGFIDLVCVISDYLELDGNFKNIYLSELQLKRKILPFSKHHVKTFLL